MADETKMLLERAAQVVELARKAGAEHAWADAHRHRNVEFRMRDGAIEQVSDSTARGVSVRLFVNGRYSSSSTTDLRPAQLAGFLAETVALTRALQPDRYRAMPDAALFAGAPDPRALELHDGQVSAIGREQRTAWCEAMNARVAGQDRVISITSSAGSRHALVAAASSNGFASAYQATTANLSAYVTLRDQGESRPAAGYGVWTRHVSELGAPEAVADAALRRARALLGSAKGPTRKTRMVVDNLSAGALISRLLGPATGGAVQQKRSFWAERLGKKAVSAALTITDDPRIPRALGSRPFDQDGIAARRLPILEQGALQNLYLDVYYASKLGMAPTTGSPSNQVVTPGSKSMDALIADAGSGILVTGWLGGNMDPTTGDFSLGARGHLIERGALGPPVNEMNVTGNILELFSSLVAVGNDPWRHAPVRAPSMLFDGVHFSGV